MEKKVKCTIFFSHLTASHSRKIPRLRNLQHIGITLNTSFCNTPATESELGTLLISAILYASLCLSALLSSCAKISFWQQMSRSEYLTQFFFSPFSLHSRNRGNHIGFFLLIPLLILPVSLELSRFSLLKKFCYSFPNSVVSCTNRFSD